MARREIFFYLGLLCFSAIAISIAILTIGPFQGLESHFGLNDKEAHIGAFYALTFGAILAFKNVRKHDILISTISIGALIEIIQSLTGRSGDFGDLLADSIGASMAIAPLYLRNFHNQISNQRRKPNPQAAKAEIPQSPML